MLKPYPSERMEEWRVGDAARNPKNDYPEVMKPRLSEEGRRDQLYFVVAHQHLVDVSSAP